MPGTSSRRTEASHFVAGKLAGDEGLELGVALGFFALALSSSLTAVGVCMGADIVGGIWVCKLLVDSYRSVRIFYRSVRIFYRAVRNSYRAICRGSSSLLTRQPFGLPLGSPGFLFGQSGGLLLLAGSLALRFLSLPFGLAFGLLPLAGSFALLVLAFIAGLAFGLFPLPFGFAFGLCFLAGFTLQIFLALKFGKFPCPHAGGSSPALHRAVTHHPASGLVVINKRSGIHLQLLLLRVSLYFFYLRSLKFLLPLSRTRTRTIIRGVYFLFFYYSIILI